MGVSFYLSTLLGFGVGFFSLYLGGAHVIPYFCLKKDHDACKYAYNHVFGNYVGLKTALKKKLFRWFVGWSHLIAGSLIIFALIVTLFGLVPSDQFADFNSFINCLAVILMLLYSMIFQVRHSVKRTEGAFEWHGIIMFCSALFLLICRFHAVPPSTFTEQGLNVFVNTVIACVTLYVLLNVMHFCSGANKEQMQRAYQQFDAMRHGENEKYSDAKAFSPLKADEEVAGSGEDELPSNDVAPS